MDNIESNNNSLYSFLKSKISITSIIIFVISELFSLIFIEKINEIKLIKICDKNINTGGIVIIVLLLVLFFTLIFEYIIVNNKMIKQESLRYQELIKSLSEADQNEGDAIFKLAMALDTYEPVKFDLLSKASKEYHHVYSGMYIGNIYHSGLYRYDKVIVEKDNKKAFDKYLEVLDFDSTGMVAWRIGWMYERGQIELDLSEAEQQEKALYYYKKSAQLNYAKAYNSLGKFYQFGYGGLDQDRFEAIKNYSKAENLGDIYAALNRAYVHCTEEIEYHLAIECFEKAIKTGSPLAYLKFGNFLEEHLDYFNGKYSISYVLSLYRIAAISNNGGSSARAYYHIGELLSKNIEIIFYNKNNDIFEYLCLENKCDIITACYSKSLTILQNLLNNKVNLKYSEKILYEQLSSK